MFADLYTKKMTRVPHFLFWIKDLMDTIQHKARRRPAAISITFDHTDRRRMSLSKLETKPLQEEDRGTFSSTPAIQAVFIKMSIISILQKLQIHRDYLLSIENDTL